MSNDYVNNYNIIVLGPSGSGKTVYLASMFKKLSTQSLDLPFFIETNANQRKQLIDKYNQMANPSATWPKGTTFAEVSEWKFFCSIRSPAGGHFQALQFTYLDYAGGRITDVQPEDENEEEDQFEERATKADAVLGLIDGQRLLDFMNNPSSNTSKTFVLRDLSATITLMQKCQGPIHFVITKWDLLEDLYSLGKIRKSLLQIEEFNNIIQQRRDPVWLIPVSSVGKGFAEPQLDGSMRKTGANIKPLYVEMPFCCVLPDCLRNDVKRLLREEAVVQETVDKLSNQPTPRLAVPVWKRMLGGALRFTGGTLNILFGLDDSLFRELGRHFDLLVRNKEDELRKERERLYNKQKETLQQVVDRKTAVNHALTCFEHVQVGLKLKFPEANLS
jgi:GTPase SAR1 family protein